MAISQQSTSKRARRVYLFTHPRVASNLLVKILNLNKQNVPPTDKGGGYFFRDPVLQTIRLRIRHKPVTIWTEDELTTIRDLYEKSFSGLNQWLDTAENNNQVAFIKEHVGFLADPVSQAKCQTAGSGHHRQDKGIDEKAADVGTQSALLPKQWQLGECCNDIECLTPSPLNETVLSDEFLLSFTPTFLIRHPACVFPSNFRARFARTMPATDTEALEMVAEMKQWVTFRWTRNLYQFYASNGIEPLVLDADDVIYSREVVVKYAKHVGLDVNKLTWDWEPAEMKKPENDLVALQQRYTATITCSSGVRQDKSTRGLDLELEKKKWKEEFGEIIGHKMVGWVEAAMEDYKFFHGRRLKPSGDAS